METQTDYKQSNNYVTSTDYKQGDWIENFKTFCWECSKCGNSALCNKIGVQIKSRFCPICGTKMTQD